MASFTLDQTSPVAPRQELTFTVKDATELDSVEWGPVGCPIDDGKATLTAPGDPGDYEANLVRLRRGGKVDVIQTIEFSVALPDEEEVV